MARYVMRAWLADRPGALGILTTALGEIGADVISIDILERDGGRVVDELTVAVPDQIGPAELAAAAGANAIVQVEDVRSVVDRLPYPGSDPLEVAVGFARQRTTGQVAEVLAHGVASVFSGDWAVVLGDGAAAPLATAGHPPATCWLEAFVAGASCDLSPSSEPRGPRDIAWAALEYADATVVVGRGGPPFRSKERRQLLQLSQLADARWRELAIRAGMIAHPSAGQPMRTHPAAAS